MTRGVDPVREDLGDGIVWWTLGARGVLELAPVRGVALELALERAGPHTAWCWRTDDGVVLARVIAARA